MVLGDHENATRVRKVLAEFGWSDVGFEGAPDLVIADADVPLPDIDDKVVLVRVGGGDEASVERALSEHCHDYWRLPLRIPLIRVRLQSLGDQLSFLNRLQEKEEQLHSMVLNNPGVVYRCSFDEGWTMEFISERVESLMGYPPEDFVEKGRTYASIMVPEDQDRVSEEVQSALDEDRTFSLEYRVVRADGETIWVNSRGRGIRGTDGALRYLDGAIFDISQEKVASEQLRSGAAAMEEKNAELQRLDALKNRMFQNVSHELRTPLSLILAPVERLLSKATDDENGPTLRSIRSNSLRLLEQINSILDLARIDAQGIAVRPRTIDITEYLARLYADFSPAAQDRSVTLSTTAPEPTLFISMDPTHLERILLNLVANALKFTPAGGRIDVRVSQDAEKVVFEVEDTGCGIPHEAQARIFDRFAQVEDRPGNAPSGTGIGLSMVRELTVRMGGELALRSEPGEGSTFSVSFDASRICTPTNEVVDRPPTESSSGIATFDRQAQLESLRSKPQHTGVLRAGVRGPLVLIAEDDPDLAQEMVQCLSDRFRVIAVPDGVAALEALEHDTPSAVVSDVGMPRMDGIELCRHIRERADFQQVGIVLLSAHADVADRIRGRRTGVDAYMTKPFHPEELVAAVEGILRSRLRLVGNFEVHERLGQGGHGTVFLGESIETGEFVALKLLSGGPTRDGTRRDALRAELKVLHGLDHPNIVHVVDQGTDDGTTYLVMEYLDGASLLEMMTVSRPITEAQTTTIVLGICEALAYLEEQGLVHQDLKPSNVLILRGGPRDPSALKLIDFGIAHTTAQTTTNAGNVSGTPAYMAPELLSGALESGSHATDIYALGVLAFFMLTDQLPRQPAENNVSSVELSQLDGNAHAEWIRAALSTSPEERPSATELLLVLRAFRHDANLPVLPPRSGVARELGATL